MRHVNDGGVSTNDQVSYVELDWIRRSLQSSIRKMSIRRSTSLYNIPDKLKSKERKCFEFHSGLTARGLR